MAEVNVKKVILPNGEEYGYREVGSGENLVLMIHGNLVSSRHWGPLLTAFGDEYRIVALDIRGQGVSSYNKRVEGYGD